MVRVRYSFSSRKTGRIGNIKKQRGKYPDIMKEVVRISEIVLEIIDVRFIEETRNRELEKSLKTKGKKIIFVLNKADLVNKKEVEKTIPKDMKPYVFISAKTRRGANALRSLIRMEAKRVDIGEKKRVQVGIVGYPNAGKSSLINLISRRGAAKTSKQAGYTRGMQKIRLTENILLLDTPGVIQESQYSTNKREAITRDVMVGARTFSDIKDPENVVHKLMETNSKSIEGFYGIDAKRDTEILIEKLGQKKKFLGKGGKTDTDRASRLILRDWQLGKIRA
jgi:small GTP-binding protein